MDDSVPQDVLQKQCTGECRQFLPATTEYFHAFCYGKYGLTARCKVCRKNSRKPYKEYTREYEQHKRKRPAEYQLLKQQYNLAYTEQRAQYDKLYRENHREERRTHEQNREALKKLVGGSHTAQDIREQLKRQKHRCYYCGQKFKKADGKHIFHIDHTFPLSRANGSDPINDISYLVLACPPCNVKKGNKYPWEWPQGGRLM